MMTMRLTMVMLRMSIMLGLMRRMDVMIMVIRIRMMVMTTIDSL